MDNVQKETHVVSVMTDLYKETCTVVRDEKGDRPLPHQNVNRTPSHVTFSRVSPHSF